MMSTSNMGNCYSEVIAILNELCEEDYNKVPKDLIETIKMNINPTYTFKYNPNKTLDEQNVSKEAKTIIAILFRDYWANTTQREKILAKEKNDMLIEEQNKQKKYPTDNIFGNQKDINSTIEEDNTSSTKELSLIERKKHWYNKFFDKILNLFRR